MVLRISRDEMLLEVAGVIAKRGTCSRAQVGAVFSRGGRIISTGYNGAPAGMPHCAHSSYQFDENDDYVFPNDRPRWAQRVIDIGKQDGHNFARGDWFHFDGFTTTMRHGSEAEKAPGCNIVQHAERNAIAYAARYGVALDGAELHCTHAPCYDCAKSIINAGLTRVVYSIPYRLTQGVELLEQVGIEVVFVPAEV